MSGTVRVAELERENAQLSADLAALRADYADLKQQLAHDPTANPPDKYNVLEDVLDWATNVGYRGYATAAIDETFSTWVLNTMFAKAATGAETPG